MVFKLVIVDRIKALCQESGIKQQYLFQKLGVNRTLFADWERGKSKPSENHIQIIADILHTTPAYLRGETDEKEKPAIESLSDSELDAEFMRLFKQLSPEQQEIIKASIKGILDAKKE